MIHASIKKAIKHTNHKTTQTHLERLAEDIVKRNNYCLPSQVIQALRTRWWKYFDGVTKEEMGGIAACDESHTQSEPLYLPDTEEAPQAEPAKDVEEDDIEEEASGEEGENEGDGYREASEEAVLETPEVVKKATKKKSTAKRRGPGRPRKVTMDREL